jgi:glycosyltransferase involved in cell wall biosynthesis
LLLPSVSEGWPNVISEALAHGVVPLAGAVSVIPQMLREIRAGKAMDPMDTMAYIQAILGYVSDPPRWKRESLAGLAEAYRFTHSLYLKALRGAFSKAWG